MINKDIFEEFIKNVHRPFILEGYIYSFKKYLSNTALKKATIDDIVLELHRFDKYLFLRYPDLADITKIESHHISDYMKFNLEELHLQKKTINRKLRAIRKFLNYMTLIYSANGRHLLDHNPALKVPYYKLDADKLPCYIPKGVLRTIIDELGKKRYGITDIAITKMLAYTGLKLNEILHLWCDQIDMEERTISITRGKDKKKYILRMPDDLYKSLKSYINMRNSELAKNNDYLFLSRTGNRYTARSYQYAFKNALLNSGIQANYTPRHVKASFAYYMAQTVPKEKLKVLLNQQKVEHYYVDVLSENPLLIQ